MSKVHAHLERELKLHLNYAQWALIRSELGTPVSTLQQTNTYFDTADGALRRMRAIMVRIRQEGTAYELTIKDRIQGESSGALETRERNEPLEPLQAQSVIAGDIALAALPTELSGWLRHALDAPLHPLGVVRNCREVFELSQGYFAELDRTEFPGGHVDYEVEIELRGVSHTFDGARASLQARTSVNCSELPPSRSKYGRFLRHIAAIKQ